MKNENNTKTLAIGAGVGALLASMGANAAVDTSTILAVTTDILAAVGTIGLAILSIHYGKKAYVWLRPN